MKRTLSILAVLGMAAVIGTQSANAFTWSNLNPANWGNSACPKCEKKKPDCGCKKIKECDPCATGAAAPCDPCMKKSPCSVPASKPCEPCQKLQQINR